MTEPMRMSRLYAPTLREEPAEAEIPSHRILLRAGMIRRVAAGIYSFLPLAVRSLAKIERVVREEMDAIGSQELLMPAVQPAELWHESDRWDDYGPELMRLKDRHERDFCLGPTHEEVITALVRHELRSYRDLPVSLYQVQTKFRDEVRPRFGLLRGREFIMKDAYSFHADEASLQEHYDAQSAAYGRFCRRLGLDYRPVEAESGQIGGKVTTEFLALADTGEAELVYCERCDYAANVEAAEVAESPAGPDDDPPSADVPAAERVATPGLHTIAELSEAFGLDPASTVKTMAADSERGLVFFLVPGDRELNPVKAGWAVPGVELLDEERFAGYGIPKGSLGPVDAPESTRIVADRSLRGAADLMVGANEEGYHLRHVVPGRDFAVGEWTDLVHARGSDPCPRCGEPMSSARGIEVGQVFQLGTKYSDSMGATYADEDGEERPLVMGCYGIGVTRALAAVIEQHADEDGVAWPVSVAPYEVVVLPLGSEEEVAAPARDLAEALVSKGVETVIDDREERAGVKFADADLIGFPYQVIVGRRGLSRGEIELKDRATGERDDVTLEHAAEHVADLVRAARERLG